MKHYIISGILLLSSLYLVSCDDDKRTSLDISQDVDIHSFVIEGTEGTINDATASVNLIMPIGTDLTKMAPKIIVASGATITPASGATLDFSSPQTYIVKNGDLFHQYTVTAKLPEITSFIIGKYKGNINQKTKEILITMPLETNVKSLKPIIECTAGATLNPTSEERVDFTNPVIYTLSYLGKSLTYKVTVELKDVDHEPVIIYNGETISPNWWTVGSAGSVDTYDNPKPNDVNSTTTCVSIWRNPGDDPWTGGGLGGLEIDPAVYVKFSITVLKEVAGVVQLEVQGEGGSNQYIKVQYSETALGEWQKLEFVLPENHGLKKITTLLVAPHCEDTKGTSFPGHRIFWDELIAYPK